MYDRNQVVRVMQGWIGLKKSDGSHRIIIDTYNSITPLPTVKMTYDYDYCACTYSACYHVPRYDAICPTEISCGRMIEKAKKMGIWVERDDFVPLPGDGIIYAWKDPKPKEDNTVGHDHIGMVLSVNNNTMKIGEGNMSGGKCGVRTLSINGANIRGFVCPNFGDRDIKSEIQVKEQTKNTDVSSYPTLRKGDKGVWVTLMQNCLKAHGYNLDNDGIFGTETYLNLIAYQKANIVKCKWADGICGQNTWRSFL